MQDIKIIVDGVEVYAHEHVASTPPVNSPPVSGAIIDHMLFVDDYRTPTDVDDQSVIEFGRGFRFASSAARNSAGKKAVHAIAFNEILDSEIKRGYFYSVDNGSSKPLALDCVKTTSANDSKMKRAIIEGTPISSAVTKRSDTHS